MSAPSSNEIETQETDNRLSPDALGAGISIMLLLTVGQRVVGLLRQVLVCRHLAPEDLGRWNLSFSMIILLAPLIVLGLPGTFGRYAEYYRHRGQVRSFFFKTMCVTGLLTLVGAATLAVTASTSAWLVYSDASQAPLILLLVPTIIAVIAFNTLTEMMSSLRQVKLVAYMRFGHALTFSLCALALVISYRGSTKALIASYAVASILTCLAAAVPIYRAWHAMSDAAASPTMPIWSKLLPFAGWIWLSDLLSNLFAAADRYMMIHLTHSGANEAAAMIGQYHSSRIVPQLFIAVAALVATAILPYLSNDWESGARNRVSNLLQTALKGFAIATTLGGLLLMLMGPWLFGQVMGGKYAEGLAVLPMTLLYCTFYGLFFIAQNFLLCCEKGGQISIALGIGLLLNVLLNFAMVPLWGLSGGVLATVIANAISLVVVYWLNQRQGMSWQPGSFLATALPLCFLLAPIAGLCVTIAAIYFGTKHRLLFSEEELSIASATFDKFSQRFLGRTFTWFHPLNTSQ
jgi:O-antigen/teichoic acid export membrane protein